MLLLGPFLCLGEMQITGSSHNHTAYTKLGLMIFVKTPTLRGYM